MAWLSTRILFPILSVIHVCTSSQMGRCSYSHCSIIHLMNLKQRQCSCGFYKSSMDHLWISPINIVKRFGLDGIFDNRRRTVHNALYSTSYPTPLRKNPKLAVISEDVLMNLLDLNPDEVSIDERFIKLFSGTVTVIKPVSHRYGGYQFGYWAGQLGDGRAHSIGSYKNKNGETWELQLKGSGQTPYSREGDGRAVVRSSVREFLASEAMYFLGVPTSRAAALVISDDKAIRDQFYNGNIRMERCAIVLRLAPSWLRFGSIDLMHINGELSLMKNVIDFSIERFFPHVNRSSADRFVHFMWEVSNLTAQLVAKWASLGFAHGVINTDNLSVLGITIDYGPYGFVENYDPRFIPNTSDDEGRYRLDNQASAAAFNLKKLSDAIMKLYPPHSTYVTELKRVVDQFAKLYHDHLMTEFASKLGFTSVSDDLEQLVAILLYIMEQQQADFTMTFRELSELTFSQLLETKMGKFPDHIWALRAVVRHQMFPEYISLYQRILRMNRIEDNVRQRLMLSSNPRYILRNWIAEKAIVATENNDFSLLRRLEKIFRNPFTKQSDAEDLGLASLPPSWAKSLKVSCSS